MGSNHATDACVRLPPYEIGFLEYNDWDQTNHNQRTLFKILIPDKVILDYIFNDAVVLRYLSLCINDPRNNSCISCGR
jgi:hypothetical protein